MTVHVFITDTTVHRLSVVS